MRAGDGVDQRGAQVILGTFPAPVVSRPPMLGLDVVMGNFGMSVPFQEFDDSRYPVVPLADLGLDDGSPVELRRRAAAAGKVMAAICHGPLVLAAADLVDGRRIAGFTACRDDVITMGARYDFAWPAMIDGNIVPDEVPEFVDAVTDAPSGSRLRQAATPASSATTQEINSSIGRG